MFYPKNYSKLFSKHWNFKKNWSTSGIWYFHKTGHFLKNKKFELEKGDTSVPDELRRILPDVKISQNDGSALRIENVYRNVGIRLVLNDKSRSSSNTFISKEHKRDLDDYAKSYLQFAVYSKEEFRACLQKTVDAPTAPIHSIGSSNGDCCISFGTREDSVPVMSIEEAYTTLEDFCKQPQAKGKTFNIIGKGLHITLDADYNLEIYKRYGNPFDFGIISDKMKITSFYTRAYVDLNSIPKEKMKHITKMRTANFDMYDGFVDFNHDPLPLGIVANYNFYVGLLEIFPDVEVLNSSYSNPKTIAEFALTKYVIENNREYSRNWSTNIRYSNAFEAMTFIKNGVYKNEALRGRDLDGFFAHNLFMVGIGALNYNDGFYTSDFDDTQYTEDALAALGISGGTNCESAIITAYNPVKMGFKHLRLLDTAHDSVIFSGSETIDVYYIFHKMNKEGEEPDEREGKEVSYLSYDKKNNWIVVNYKDANARYLPVILDKMKKAFPNAKVDDERMTDEEASARFMSGLPFKSDKIEFDGSTIVTKTMVKWIFVYAMNNGLNYRALPTYGYGSYGSYDAAKKVATIFPYLSKIVSPDIKIRPLASFGSPSLIPNLDVNSIFDVKEYSTKDLITEGQVLKRYDYDNGLAYYTASDTILRSNDRTKISEMFDEQNTKNDEYLAADDDKKQQMIDDGEVTICSQKEMDQVMHYKFTTNSDGSVTVNYTNLSVGTENEHIPTMLGFVNEQGLESKMLLKEEE